MSTPEGTKPRGVPEGSALLMKTWSDGEARVVRALLESYEIPCQVVSDITHAVYPVNVDGLGEIRILVPASSLDEASKLIEEHLHEGLAPQQGGDAGGEAPETDGGGDGGETP